MRRSLVVLLGLVVASAAHAGGPYPTLTGISAAADDASVAGNNPAGMTRFGTSAKRFELMTFFTDNTWEGRLGDNGREFVSEDTSTTIVPSGNMVKPIRDNLWFGFTVLGSGFSEDFDDDWPGRYLVDQYDLVYISAFPSLATKLTDKLSVAASLALTYTTYEQEKAVPNLDPGAGDGRLKVDADGTTVGFALSALYELTERTRFGIVYRSEIDAELDGGVEFSDLSPRTEELLDAAGLLDARVEITSRTPQAITTGIYHEFSDGGAVTLDLVWADFSEFKLSEIYVNGDQFVESNPTYDDIFALSASYSRPVRDRWRVGFGAFWVDDMLEDENRTITLRLDSMWSAGLGLEWQWTEKRALSATLNYLEIGEAPVASPALPGIGSVVGRFADRQTIYLLLGLSLGSSGE